ncbi:mediator of RNA polymerase II transcription subunit 14-like isoform X2 [Pomacea canaliculata]|uniref:mediator of RNA polymerase II transcription subunit 14-like isoform X2 n=1 Tax=Pomacea canaliculata TaxID=400727 RepID=UPI000D72C930|nr:mediator of RNA polymerase II transcription subunit 14-like isoform X2 [Pomacea canaliculata]
MPPVENQIAVHPGPGHQGGGSIPLGTLIEYALQRTYHELTVLSELLPRKTDMDRKLEIFHFANRTRQLFVRILALVKWANSATKVDKCADICHFLEQQSMYFIETADFLHKMSKETLVTARLPSFSLPCAIDVLTTGTYPRLPACIRDKIIPPDPITPVEKKQTLQRLNQVIQYRLVSSDLPRQMRRLKIEQGRVRFFVEHEFEVTLTLMGDSPTIPWRLLDITFQVEDHETGDGKSLVHSMQVHYIHQLVQSRLLDTDKPLLDLYRVLHSFCLSLQLEVLHSQTQRLMRERLGDCIFIDQYMLSKNLVISYWRDHTRNRERSLETTVYKLSVHVCEDDDGKPLQVTHFPAMSADESRKIGLAIKSDHLSIEKLLMQTIEVRTHSKLKDLSRELQRLVDGKCEVRDMPVALHVPVLTPCMSSEVLRVTINVQTGAYMVSVPSCDQCVTDIEECLNGDRRGMDGLISRLRVQLSLLRCEKSVQLMPAVCQKSLPFVNLSGHPLEGLASTKLFIRVPRQPNVYVVVEIIEEGRGHVKYRYFLLQSVPCTLDGTEDDIEDTGVKSFLKAGHMIPVDIFSQTHGPFCRLYDDMPLQMDSLSRKRKIFLGEMDETENKKTKGSPYFVQELTYLLAHVEEKIPFVQIGEELTLQGLSHTGISVDNEGTCLSLGVLGFPDTGDTNAGKFHEQLLSCKFRIQCRASRNWIVEFVFAQGPLPTTHFKESGSSVRVCLHFDLSGDNIQKTVTELLDEWQAMQHLYFLVVDFADTYNDVRTNMMAMATIQSYDYRKLTLTYGPGRSHFVTVQWKTEARQFQLSLGTLQQSSTANPHVPLLVQLQEELNTSRSLAQLVHTLHDTWAPMTAICKLNTTSLMGTSTHPKIAVLNFTIIPQSSTHVRLIFRSCYCLDIHMKTGKVVAVRDGSYGLFDNSRVIEGLTPASGLKSFLSMFVDEKMTASHGRQRSSTEDDNPPSPIGMDMDVFMSQQQQPMLGSPATSRQLKDSSSGFRFHNNPMTPPSNPHTPASPGASRMPTGVNPSPSAALIGTPSPGTLLTANSPSNPQLHVPSPQSFVPTPSPQGLGLHMQSPAASFISPGMVDGGSPFPGTSLAMPSPGTRGWPSSPSVQGPSPASHHLATSPGHPALHSPQTHKDGEHSKVSVMSPPSRILPQRAWAAAVPTLLSHEMLTKLLTASPLQGTQFLPASPLERFFACVHLRRHMQRVIQSETSLTPGTSEPGVVSFRVESLQCKISLNPSTHQSLHLKVTPTPDFQDQWSAEEMQILERFFDLKVVCPPYKVNLLTAFGRLMGAPLRILKDCIQIMRLELMPDRSLKWSVQWCLTIPPSLHNISPPGTPAILVKSKMIFMLQFTRIGLNIEAQSLCVPMLYEISQNKVQQVDQHSSPALAAIATMLSRFAEMHHNPTECAIFPAVRELMSNLVIPMSSAV